METMSHKNLHAFWYRHLSRDFTSLRHRVNIGSAVEPIFSVGLGVELG
jgi:hypothetical protein